MDAPVDPSGQWLIRTAKNVISGPFSKEDVCRMIHEGKLSLQDEVCRANHYWIYLHETEEVRQQLGVETPKAPVGSDDDTTETQTKPPIPISLTSPPATASPDQTTLLSAEPKPPVQGNFQSGLPPGKMLVLGNIERPNIWRGVAWVLILMACGVIIAVLRLLRSAAG